MSAPLFTVVTVSYNSEKWIRYAIESVLSSSFTDFEYLVADDASSDQTWKIILEYKDPRIKAWRNEQNLGEYNNRNLALQQAKGEFILFIDGDDILYRETLKEYAGYIKEFPETTGIWCVYYHIFNFMVFPFQLSPSQLTRFNFLSKVPLTTVGLTESLFKTNVLKGIGGFATEYGTADTYAKRKLSCSFPVVLIPGGRAFWRQTPNQASQRVRKKMKNLIESFKMDKAIIESPDFPLQNEELKQAIFNFRNRRIKLVVSNTLIKFDVFNFFRLMHILDIPYKDLFHLCLKADYSYNAGATSSEPLINNYNIMNKNNAEAYS